MKRLLDLYCGAGGSAAGYAAAGFEVIGVDNVRQPHYPFEFYEADALTYSTASFDAIHASPPCQIHSHLTNLWNNTSLLNQWYGGRRVSPANTHRHKDLIGFTRAWLQTSGLPYIIENVPGAPLVNPITLCGSMFNLRTDDAYLQRHRLFESNIPLSPPGPCMHPNLKVVGVHGRGGGSTSFINSASAPVARALMQIDWMNRDEMASAIPPVYTRWLGAQLMAVVQEQAISNPAPFRTAICTPPD